MGEEVAMQVRATCPARNGIAFRLVRSLRSVAATASARLLRWHELTRQRRALLALNERMLKDIGITRAEAQREARRPFWSDGIDPGTTGVTDSSAGRRLRCPIGAVLPS
jgi:uncharacterized protein YjiS (DUF1127 family)